MSLRVGTTSRAITSYGGAELLRETARAVGLNDAVGRCLHLKARSRWSFRIRVRGVDGRVDRARRPLSRRPGGDPGRCRPVHVARPRGPGPPDGGHLAAPLHAGAHRPVEQGARDRPAQRPRCLGSDRGDAGLRLHLRLQPLDQAPGRRPHLQARLCLAPLAVFRGVLGRSGPRSPAAGQGGSFERDRDLRGRDAAPSAGRGERAQSARLGVLFGRPLRPARAGRCHLPVRGPHDPDPARDRDENWPRILGAVPRQGRRRGGRVRLSDAPGSGPFSPLHRQAHRSQRGPTTQLRRWGPSLLDLCDQRPRVQRARPRVRAPAQGRRRSGMRELKRTSDCTPFASTASWPTGPGCSWSASATTCAVGPSSSDTSGPDETVEISAPSDCAIATWLSQPWWCAAGGASPCAFTPPTPTWSSSPPRSTASRSCAPLPSDPKILCRRATLGLARPHAGSQNRAGLRTRFSRQRNLSSCAFEAFTASERGHDGVNALLPVD